jgi:hypothetical protein
MLTSHTLVRRAIPNAMLAVVATAGIVALTAAKSPPHRSRHLIAVIAAPRASLCRSADLSAVGDGVPTEVPANTEFDVTVDVTNNSEEDNNVCNLSPSSITGSGSITLDGDQQGIDHNFGPGECFEYTVHYQTGASGGSNTIDIAIHDGTPFETTIGIGSLQASSITSHSCDAR